MNELPVAAMEKLRALLHVCALELEYLRKTDMRLFSQPVNELTVLALPENDELSERVDAFVSRFGRLQDTLGDKLLPTFLAAMAERPGTMLENLDKAERLGLIASADTWLTLRKLRNRMVHEYVSDPSEMASALVSAHEHIQLLADAYSNITKRLTPFIKQS